jgi:hypothetical protein
MFRKVSVTCAVNYGPPFADVNPYGLVQLTGDGTVLLPVQFAMNPNDVDAPAPSAPL